MNKEFLNELTIEVQLCNLYTALDKVDMHCKDRFMLQNIVAQLEDVINGIRND